MTEGKAVMLRGSLLVSRLRARSMSEVAGGEIFARKQELGSSFIY